VIRRLRAGAVSSVLLATVSCVLLSGCSVQGLRYVGMGVGDFTTTWTVGSCHRLDQPEEVDPVFPSDTSPPVPCDAPHESETYAVIPLTGPVAAQPRRPSPLWLERALTGACGWDAMTRYLGATPLDALRDVGILQILPSEPEWERGVRLIRCDVLLGPRTSADVASIDRPLRAILAGPAGDRFRVCRAAGQELGCDQPHDAELINAWIKLSGRAARETAKQRTRAVLDFCHGYVARYLGAAPTARSNIVLAAGLPRNPPDPGDQVGQCWLADAKGREWTGSLRSDVRALP
jgi:Septum formation